MRAFYFSGVKDLNESVLKGIQPVQILSDFSRTWWFKDDSLQIILGSSQKGTFVQGALKTLCTQYQHEGESIASRCSGNGR